MEIMVKQTLDLGNNIAIVIIVLLFCASCKNPKLEKQDYKKDSITFSKIILDTVVNNIRLADSTSVLKHVGDISSLIENDFNFGECVTLLNNSKTQYLKLEREYGGFRNQYSYFYIGNNKKTVKSSRVKTLRDNIFISNKGAYIGMPKSKFLINYVDIKFLKETKSDTLIYSFIKENDIYTARYIFIKNNMIAFEFGYQD